MPLNIVHSRFRFADLASQVLVAWIIAQMIVLGGCAPDRAQWMAQAANQEAGTATAEIGNPQEVKSQAKAGAEMLRQMAALMQKSASTRKQQQIASSFGQDTDQLAAGLDAIAQRWDPLESTCRHASLSIL